MPFCLSNYILTLFKKPKMSSATNIAPSSVVPARLTASQLSTLLLDPAESSKIAVIDVRDDGPSPLPYLTPITKTKTDYIGGHIKSSINVPSSTLDHALPSLVRKLADKETVVFHCALSQVRGPKAAARYIRERERLEKDKGEKREQRVVVLERGFEGWQEVFGRDGRLTEEYDEKVWAEDW